MRTTESPGSVEVVRDVARCAAVTIGLLAKNRVTLPRDRIGTRLRFADGTTSVVFRETDLRGPFIPDPVVLCMRFRLRLMGTRPLPHAVFRAICVLNTVLFAGFPGFLSKLWITDLDTGFYRGLYEWRDAESAEHYARTLGRVLALVSEPGSVSHHIVPGLRRDAYLANPNLAPAVAAEPDGWWRLAEPAPAP
jgi:hypothetical protein